MHKKIGVFGSIAMDNIFRADSVPRKGERVFGSLLGSYIGGIAANQAIEAARYSDEVYILGTVGEDEIGNRIYDHFRKRNCQTDFLLRNPDFPTGSTYMYLIDDNKDYYSIVDLGTNNHNDKDRLLESLDELDVLLITLEINTDVVEPLMDYARAKGIFTYLCLSPAENCTRAMVEKADALIGNLREAEMLLGIKAKTPEGVIEELRTIEIGNCNLFVISMGNMGAVIKEGDHFAFAKALDIVPLDTVGAGDAFTGTFVANREMGMDAKKALCYGCIAGGLTVSVVGAQSSEHTAEYVEELYHKYYKSEDKK